MESGDERTFGERVSDGIAKFGGSWSFIFWAAGILSFWVMLNVCSWFEIVSWDKYPFILLNLFLSMIAALQAPFIMMSQRRCEFKQDMIYRSLFREIKELVETDLAVEHEIKEQNRLLAEEVAELKEIIRQMIKMSEPE